MIEKTWLLQESITHPTTDFKASVNKKLTSKCSINDCGTTIFFRNPEMLKRTWLLYESITYSTTVFSAFVNKRSTFNCSINDVGTTIFFYNAETLEKCDSCRKYAPTVV